METNDFIENLTPECIPVYSSRTGVRISSSYGMIMCHSPYDDVKAGWYVNSHFTMGVKLLENFEEFSTLMNSPLKLQEDMDYSAEFARRCFLVELDPSRKEEFDNLSQRLWTKSGILTKAFEQFEELEEYMTELFRLDMQANLYKRLAEFEERDNQESTKKVSKNFKITLEFSEFELPEEISRLIHAELFSVMEEVDPYFEYDLPLEEMVELVLGEAVNESLKSTLSWKRVPYANINCESLPSKECEEVDS